ncbi:type IV secretion system protein [Kitasatospora sp. NPDC004669]|uniref:SCO6881 family protein n=1 Tax=Kitasatospora sp. NPDC004669 TaxID=3154555 RepID=UPI0033A6FFD6
MGGIGDSITSSIGNWIAKSCGDLAQSAVDLASRAVDTTTAIDLNAAWFRSNYAVVLAIALVMLIMTFCFQLGRAAWRRDGQALGQAVTGTISGLFFSFTAIAFTGVAVTVVDALSKGLFQIANSSVNDAVRRIVKISLIPSLGGLGWAIATVVALGCAVGCLMYWGMMVLRKVTVLVLVVLAPLAGAGGGWEPTRVWRQRWIEATATIVFSKLVITIIFLLGVSAIGDTKPADGIGALSDVIAGIVIMALVLLSPFALYRFVHWAGDGASHDLHRTTAAGLQVAQGAAKKAASMAAGGAGGGAAAASSAAPQGPSEVPGMNNIGGGPSSSGSESSTGGGQTTFKYANAGRSGQGDGGVPLITRPPTDGDRGQPLITRAGTSTATGGATGAGAASGTGTASVAAPTTAAGTAGGATPVSTGSGPASAPASSGPAFDPVIASAPAKPATSSGAGRFIYPGPTNSSS